MGAPAPGQEHERGGLPAPGRGRPADSPMIPCDAARGAPFPEPQERSPGQSSGTRTAAGATRRTAATSDAPAAARDASRRPASGARRPPSGAAPARARRSRTASAVSPARPRSPSPDAAPRARGRTRRPGCRRGTAAESARARLPAALRAPEEGREVVAQRAGEIGGVHGGDSPALPLERQREAAAAPASIALSVSRSSSAHSSVPSLPRVGSPYVGSKRPIKSSIVSFPILIRAVA